LLPAICTLTGPITANGNRFHAPLANLRGGPPGSGMDRCLSTAAHASFGRRQSTSREQQVFRNTRVVRPRTRPSSAEALAVEDRRFAADPQLIARHHRADERRKHHRFQQRTNSAPLASSGIPAPRINSRQPLGLASNDKPRASSAGQKALETGVRRVTSMIGHGTLPAHDSIQPGSTEAKVKDAQREIWSLVKAEEACRRRKRVTGFPGRFGFCYAARPPPDRCAATGIRGSNT